MGMRKRYFGLVSMARLYALAEEAFENLCVGCGLIQVGEVPNIAEGVHLCHGVRLLQTLAQLRTDKWIVLCFDDKKGRCRSIRGARIEMLDHAAVASKEELAPHRPCAFE